MDNMWILAQADSQEAPSQIGSEVVQGSGAGEATTIVPDTNEPGATGVRQRSPLSPWMTMTWLVLIFVVMYMVVLRGPRKQQQQHKQLVQSLKKNDRIRTIGGIYGTIMDVKDDEVVLKVDESNNTKIRVSLSAISKNLSQEGKE